MALQLAGISRTRAVLDHERPHRGGATGGAGGQPAPSLTRPTRARRSVRGQVVAPGDRAGPFLTEPLALRRELRADLCPHAPPVVNRRYLAVGAA
jgi:hypothetical protein